MGLVRTNNEDSFFMDEGAGLFVVADGMGGHASGEIASNMAVTVIRDYLKNENNPHIGDYNNKHSVSSNRLMSAVRLANKAIFEASLSNAGWKGMGTTITALLLKGNSLSIAHVGDSRAYLVRSGSMEQLTNDHSLVAEQFRQGLLNEEDLRQAENRNILIRAAGVGPEVAVDSDEMTMFAGDRLLVCSDGLTGMVGDDELLSVLLACSSPEADCDRLIAMAKKNGGRDNITVLLLYIDKISLIPLIKYFFGRGGVTK